MRQDGRLTDSFSSRQVEDGAMAAPQRKRYDWSTKSNSVILALPTAISADVCLEVALTAWSRLITVRCVCLASAGCSPQGNFKYLLSNPRADARWTARDVRATCVQGRWTPLPWISQN